MSETEEGVGVDLTPPSFLQRRREGEPHIVYDTEQKPISGHVSVQEKGDTPETRIIELEPELPVDKLPTLEELIALIKSLVGQRKAIDEKIRILNRHAEKMLREISKPKQ